MNKFDLLIRIPGSSSNLGPGFDVLGIAVSLHLKIRVQPSPSRAHILLFSGEGSDQLSCENDNLILRVAQRVARRLKFRLPPLRLSIENQIPISRGLGSSAAAILAGVTVAEILSSGKLSREDVLRFAMEFESHPDNLAACLVGGFTAARRISSQSAVIQSLPLDPRLKIVAAIPDFTVSTKEARRVLPKHLARPDAIHNLQNAVLLSHVLGKITSPSAIRPLFEDHLHQPYRHKLVPGMKEALALPDLPGLVGVFLSGSGSTLAALALRNFSVIGRALQNCFSKNGLSSRMLVLDIDRKGRRSRQLA